MEHITVEELIAKLNTLTPEQKKLPVEYISRDGYTDAITTVHHCTDEEIPGFTGGIIKLL